MSQNYSVSVCYYAFIYKFFKQNCPLGHSVHVHPALCLFPLVTVYMYTLHYASSPWSQCTCTPCTMPLPLGLCMTCTPCTMPLPFGHSVHVHPALGLFPLVSVHVHPALGLFPLVTVYMTCTSCTMPLPLGHSVHVHPALGLFPLVTVCMYTLH